MIVDSSAILAILGDEPEARAFATVIKNAPSVSIAAPTLVEVRVVADRSRSAEARAALEDLIQAIGARVEPFTADHAELAARAHRLYGRGSGHPARLNYGDTFSYALAKATGEPLLFKGDDFVHTDIRSALA